MTTRQRAVLLLVMCTHPFAKEALTLRGRTVRRWEWVMIAMKGQVTFRERNEYR